MQTQANQPAHYPPWAPVLAQCGGHKSLSECAQYPFSQWLNAHDAGEIRDYWPWVWARATEDGIAIEALSESEASRNRRTRVLPGAI